MTCQSYNIEKFISPILPSCRTFIDIKSVNDKLKQFNEENNSLYR